MNSQSRQEVEITKARGDVEVRVDDDEMVILQKRDEMVDELKMMKFN